ncbi:Ig-like domain-containing protein [Paenibacillus oryzisoli]|uniref:Ig-like domain-containing protein n=1 Tax=Paenibacillus oryzisoli TaxID=1850517 RepID=UPI003D29C357
MKRLSHTKWLSLVLILALASQVLWAGAAFAADSISKLVLNKNEISLQVGDTATLSATAIFVSGTTENATVKTDWNSGTPEVASVYAGVVTAKKEGKAIITATYMGETEVVTVTVSKKVKSLTSDVQSLDLRLNSTQQLAITAYYEDGTSENVSSLADYTVDASTIATVTNGLVRGQNPGSGTITVKYMNQSLTLDVDVEVVRRLDADKSDVSLLKDGTSKVKLMATYPDGTTSDVASKAVWTSDKPDVADVINGTITGYSVGKATLTASYGTKTTTIRVDVDSTVKLELDKTSILLKKNGTGQLKLTATYADGSTSDISDRAEWSSSDEDVVQVTKGKLLGTDIGEATVFAKYGDRTVAASIDVEVPHRLVVSADSLTLQADGSASLDVYATYADGTTATVTDSAIWSVDHEDIAMVTKGTVKAFKSGVATITASYGGKTTTTRVEIDVPTSVKLSQKAVNMQSGDSANVTLTAYFKDRSTGVDVTDKATWTSSDEDIAEASKGAITGVATGAATVTAEYGTRKAVLQVSVGELKSLTVSEDKLVMKKGGSATLKAEALYTDDTKSDVTSDVIWTSSNTKAATVDQGVVKAIASGTSTLTAQLDNKTVTIPVEVDMASDLTASVINIVMDLNETRSIVLTATDASETARTVTSDAEWKTSNASILSVSKGVVTPVARGKATVTATYGGKSISIPVEIGVIDSLKASKTFFITKSGEQTQLTVTATMSDGTTKDVTNSATWKVSAYKIGSVDNGLFTAIGSGKTTITVSFGGKTVAIPVEVDTLKYLKTDVVKIELKEGQTANVSAIATYSDGSEDDVTKPALWTTSNIMIADVKDGVIKATGKGTARISVTFANMRTTVQVTVTK